MKRKQCPVLTIKYYRLLCRHQNCPKVWEVSNFSSRWESKQMCDCTRLRGKQRSPPCDLQSSFVYFADLSLAKVATTCNPTLVLFGLQKETDIMKDWFFIHCLDTTDQDKSQWLILTAKLKKKFKKIVKLFSLDRLSIVEDLENNFFSHCRMRALSVKQSLYNHLTPPVTFNMFNITLNLLLQHYRTLPFYSNQPINISESYTKNIASQTLIG